MPHNAGMNIIYFAAALYLCYSAYRRVRRVLNIRRYARLIG